VKFRPNADELTAAAEWGAQFGRLAKDGAVVEGAAAAEAGDAPADSAG